MRSKKNKSSAFERSSMYQLVFIIGSGRSGTTLLRNTFAEYENVVFLPETNFFRKIYSQRIFNRKGRGLIDIFSQPINRVGKGLRYDSIWDTVELKELRRIAVFKSYGTFLSSIINYFIEKHQNDCDFVIEKTPGHVFFVKEISKLYPKAKIIYIERDIKQVVSSYLKFFPGMNIYRHIAHRRYCSKYWQAKKHTIRNAYIEVNYNELTYEFVETMVRLTAFLGLPKKDFENKPNLCSPTKYVTNLSHKQIDLIERIDSGKDISVFEKITFNKYVFKIALANFISRYGLRPIFSIFQRNRVYAKTIKHS
jgi:hypothetical protein